MSKTRKPSSKKPTSKKDGLPQRKEQEQSGTSLVARRDFWIAASNMTWQLAAVVLLPIIGGVQLDKALNTTSSVWTFVGLGVAFVGSGVVMWRAMQLANQLPVPKLSASQRRAIQKQYEEDDD